MGVGVGIAVTGSGVWLTGIGLVETEETVSLLLLHAWSVQRTHNANTSGLMPVATTL